MSVDVRVDPETGRLLVSDRAWAALLHLGGAAAEPPAGLPEALAALRAAGVAGDGELAEPLRRVAAVVAEPSALLELTRRGHEARGWLAADGAALLVPRADGLRELVVAAPRFLPELLARLIELGPRATSERAPRAMSPGELAQAIAHSGPPDAVALPPVRDHWQLELRPAEAGSWDSERIEALDTEDGWWRLTPAGSRVAVTPLSATALWRDLVRLVVRGLTGP